MFVPHTVTFFHTSSRICIPARARAHPSAEPPVLKLSSAPAQPRRRTSAITASLSRQENFYSRAPWILIVSTTLQFLPLALPETRLLLSSAPTFNGCCFGKDESFQAQRLLSMVSVWGNSTSFACRPCPEVRSAACEVPRVLHARRTWFRGGFCACRVAYQGRRLFSMVSICGSLKSWVSVVLDTWAVCLVALPDGCIPSIAPAFYGCCLW